MNGYYAGWDGGGTGTTIECVDPEGTVLYRGVSGPMNINGNDPADIWETVLEAARNMETLPGGVRACLGLCVASAGVSNPASEKRIGGFLAEAGFTAPFLFAGDHESAFHGALEGGAGILLISGTGSICYGKNNRGQSHRCGGWGHLIDDAGSGYAIGREVLSAVVMEADGRQPKGLLTEMVFRRLGIDRAEDLIGFVYAPETSKRDIAALAPLAAEARERGDEAAARIEAKAAEDLYRLCETTAAALSLTEAPLVLSGSVLNKNLTIRGKLLEKVHASLPGLKPRLPAGDAAHGAAMIARSAFGTTTNE